MIMIVVFRGIMDHNARRGKAMRRQPKLSSKEIIEGIRLTEREHRTLNEVAGTFGVERSTLFKAMKRFRAR